MPRGNGGIIGPVNTSFSGVWSLTEAQLRRSGNTWPNFYTALLSESATGSDVFSGADAADPYFEYTTLLLPGNGTNGAQNNTFLDASTNNFTITRNGNTTQGTFSPFSQTGWGNYFGGSGNYLKVADGTALDLPGDFTLEGWFYFSSLSSNNGIIGYGSEAASQNGFSLYWAASTVNKLRIYSNGAALLTGTTTLSANTWNHIAVVRSGSGSNNLTVYVNGAVDQTATTTTSFTGGAALGMGIGINYDGTFYNPFTGYASNVRLVKGQALATGAFTPPTSPVTTSSVGWTGANAAASLTGTVSVLTCQSNRFVDNSASPLTITVTGSPSVQAFSPFNPTASWSATTNGGSGYFDGSGDYLSVTDNDAWHFGSGNFTIEAWYYPTTTSAQQIIVAQSTAVGGGTGLGWQLMTSNDSNVYLRALVSADGSGWVFDLISSSKLQISAWNHVAFVRNGTTFQLYLNGAAATSGSTTSSSTLYNTTTPLTIGASNAPNQYATGYVSGVRIVKGTAIYTGSTYTVPTSPLTAIANTSLLLNFTNAGIYDATSKNDLETVGNAQISTAVSAKWGSGCMAFDGTGDYLTPQNNPQNAMGTGDFTIEAWIYPTSVTSTAVSILSNRSDAGADTVFTFAFSTTIGLYFHTQATAVLNSGTPPTANIWQHVALVRSSGTLRIYLNGTQIGSSASFTSNLSSTLPLLIGHDGTRAGPTADFAGYIQDLRITRGYARYVTGTGANAGKMVFNGTNDLALPTAAFPTL